MVNFAQWGLTVEMGCEWEGGTFWQGYQKNRYDAGWSVLEVSPVAKALSRRWKGWAADSPGLPPNGSIS